MSMPQWAMAITPENPDRHRNDRAVTEYRYIDKSGLGRRHRARIVEFDAIPGVCRAGRSVALEWSFLCGCPDCDNEHWHGPAYYSTPRDARRELYNYGWSIEDARALVPLEWLSVLRIAS